eukprot:Gb_11871 [translate_table: standard]
MQSFNLGILPIKKIQSLTGVLNHMWSLLKKTCNSYDASFTNYSSYRWILSSASPALDYAAFRNRSCLQSQECFGPCEQSKRDKRLGSIVYFSSGSYSCKSLEVVSRLVSKYPRVNDNLEVALKTCGVSMTAELVEQVLERCDNAGEYAFRFFLWAGEQTGYKHSMVAYNAIIKILGKMRQFETVWKLLQEMREEDSSLITTETFIILMRRFAAAHMVQQAIQLLDEMPKFGCKADVYAFGCLLDALCKNNHIHEAVVLFEDMKTRFSPNLRNYNILLCGWCKMRNLEQARAIFYEMTDTGLEPDMVTYNTLLNGYAKTGEIGLALDFLGVMKKRGCPPNTMSYTNLVQALCIMDRIEEATIVFTDMKRNGCLPDVVVHNKLIEGLCKTKKLDQAYRLLDDMIQQGCTPNNATYFCLLREHERRGELQEALKLIQEMSRTGCSCNLSIYNTVIRLSCMLGHLNEAFTLWADMQSKGLCPDLDTYTIMIHGLLKHNYFREACIHFKEMIEKGLLCSPPYGTLKDLLNGLLREGEHEMAVDLWEKMKKRGCDLNIFAYTIWVQALHANSDLKEASQYCIEMLEHGHLPQPRTYNKLMKGLKEIYDSHTANELTERLIQVTSARTINFKNYVKEGQREAIGKRRARNYRWNRRCSYIHS